MLVLRLQPTGRKREKTYRVVVTEHKNRIGGKPVEVLGSFAAIRREDSLLLNTERAAYWISVGAQPSDAVARILVGKGVQSAEKFVERRVLKPSKAEVEAKAAAEAAKKAEAEAKAAAEAAKKAEAEAKAAAEAVPEVPAEEAQA